jgi:hypothetical protein
MCPVCRIAQSSLREALTCGAKNSCLAREDLSVEQIANKMKFAPVAIIKAGRRLGLHLSPIEPKRDGRLKVKAT